MGDSGKAVYEDRQELEEALIKLGLHGDKKWGSVELYSLEARVIVYCASKGFSLEETIREIYKTKYARQAEREANKEIEERRTLALLSENY